MNPAIKIFVNCGDWVESCTAIVETFDGEFMIINWLEKDATNENTNQ